MNLQERKQYNLVIFVLFGVLFALFGGLGVLAHLSTPDFGPFPNLPPLLGGIVSGLFFGLMGGWGFTGLVGGVWLGFKFVSRQSRGFIVVACVFFMFTLQIFWLVGIFVTIPFAIYNIVQARRGIGEQKWLFQPPGASQGPPAVRIKLRAAHVVSFVAIFVLVLFAFILFDFHSGNRFFPSIEEAFAHTAEGSGQLGEILFLDEHKTNVTVFSLRDGHLIVSHYVTELREEERWYRTGGVSGHVPLYFPGSARFLIHNIVNEEGFFGGANRRLRESFGRRPLYGTYRHEVIRNLSINGIPVEYVFEFTNDRGERMFFWYFSDFPPSTGSQDDIVISFEPS